MGGSGEKDPSKDIKKDFFQISNLSQPVFLPGNPPHWGLEAAVCPFCAKPVLDIFAVCCSTRHEFVSYATGLFMPKESKLLTREG